MYPGKYLSFLERVFAARLVDAIKNASIHSEDFKNFDEGMTSLFTGETLDGWLQQVTEWETDFSKPCPYEPTVRSKLTLNEVKLQLQKEEQLELSKTPESVVPESSASAFISLALQIEELQ